MIAKHPELFAVALVVALFLSGVIAGLIVKAV